MPTLKPKDVDGYIAGFPLNVQRRLKEMRAAVKKAAPSAEERISYGMPAYKLDGALLGFAAFKSHLGLYPVTRVVRTALGPALSAYTPANTKATARFPLAKPIPRTLVAKIVKVRIKENAERQRRRNLQ